MEILDIIILKNLLFSSLQILCMSTRLVLPEPTAPATEATAEPRDEALGDTEEPPEGYYAFVESPNATPPR